MTSLTVTATQTGTSGTFQTLQVKVLTGAKVSASQSGTTEKKALTSNAPNNSITPSATGSLIYGGMLVDGGTSWTAEAASTIQQTVSGSGKLAGVFRSTSTTTASTPTTQGATAPSATFSGLLAQAEILAATTLAEDASSPSAVATQSTDTVTTASFSPPPGSLLVAVAVANVASGTDTLVISDSSGLTWTTLVQEDPASEGAIIVAVADIQALTVTGTGSVRLPKMSVAGFTRTNLTGTGSVRLPKMSVAAAGQLGFPFPANVLGLLIELNVGGVWTDITGYVYQRSPITITRGRPDESSTVNPSVCTLTLNNRDGRFSSRNPSGPYYGKIGRNAQLRIRAQDNWVPPYGMAYRFWGEISAWPQGWDPTGADVYVMITASGVLRRFGQGAIIGAALDRFYSRLSDNTVPVGWWPCEDGSGATSIASGLPGGSAMQFTGTPSLAANSDFACCTAIPTLGGSTWTGQIPTTGSGNTEGLFLVSSAGSGTFTGPQNSPAVNVQTWGGGSGGTGGYPGTINSVTSGLGGPGGSGGEWAAEINVPTTQGTSYSYTVGAGSAGSASGDHKGTAGGTTTITIGAKTVTAHGGQPFSGSLNLSVSGSDISSVTWEAGSGGTGSSNAFHENGGYGSSNVDTSGPGSEAGMGGGASGGTSSSGGFQPALTQTGADAVPGGGPGGDGGDDTPTSGNVPAAGPGGGGGGGGGTASTADPGGAGHDGMLKISWIIPGSGGFVPDSNVMRFLLEAAQGDADGGVIWSAETFGTISTLNVMYRAGAAVLSAPVSGTITALTVNALPAAIPAGTVTLWSSAGSQAFTTSGASSGATSIPVSSVAVVNTTEAGDAITIGTTQPGYLELAGYNAIGSVLLDSGPQPFAANGAQLMVSAELTPDGSGNIDWLLSALDTVTGSIVASYTGSVTAATLGQVSAVVANPGGALSSTATGEITIQYDSVPLASMALPAAAYAGETAAARLTRFGGEEGITVVIVGDGTTSALMGPQAAGSQVLDVLQQCEDADRGLLFEPRDTFGLGYRCRTSLYNQSPAVTLNYTSAQVMDPLLPTDDDLLTVNDVTVSRDNGSSVTTALQAGTMSIQPPPAGVGDYTFSLTAVVDSDAQLADLAGWIVHVGTVDEMRYPSVNNALERTEAQAVFTDSVYCDIGDYFSISNPPAWQPPGTIRQLVYGLNETLNAFTWRIEANCVPESPYEVAVIGTTWHVDTDGSSLHGNISGAATTLQADTPAGNALWTLTDVPFDILVGGERMTVTAVTGSSSPQTMTVTRGVNGVTLAITAGTPISLFYPPVVAL